MGFMSDFQQFLEQYKVMGLVVAFIMGLATNSLVQSLVNNIIMPIATFFIPNGSWQSANVVIGTVHLGVGSFTSAVINFVILALVIFAIVKLYERGTSRGIAGKGKK